MFVKENPDRKKKKKKQIFVTIVFFKKGFRFQIYECNSCHDLLMMFISLSDIVILNIKGGYYCCIISGINKNEAINLMQNIDLT